MIVKMIFNVSLVKTPNSSTYKETKEKPVETLTLMNKITNTGSIKWDKLLLPLLLKIDNVLTTLISM